jgi:D-arabinose 1-dehydrogenase-like Zn-dependent alcohol dehydrogenase
MLIVQQQRVIGSLVGSRVDMRELLRLAVLYDIRPVTETYSLSTTSTSAYASMTYGSVRC